MMAGSSRLHARPGRYDIGAINARVIANVEPGRLSGKSRFTDTILSLVSRYSADSIDSDEWRLKKTIAIVTVLFGTLFWFMYSLMHFHYHQEYIGRIDLSVGVLNSLGLISYGFIRRYAAHWYYWGTIYAIALCADHILLGGFALSGFVLLWIFVFPICTLVVQRPMHGLRVFIATVAVFVCIGLVQPFFPITQNHFPAQVISNLFMLNAVSFSSYLLLIVFYYIRQNLILSRKLVEENEKADRLLLNILPAEIAESLKKEERIIADQYDNTSILFADIVDFTPISAALSPTRIVEILNEMFSHFDELADSYGLEKIKTRYCQ